jgi:tryptophan-rich sensory protein
MLLKQAIKYLFSPVVGWIIVFELISAAIGFSTSFGMYPWYIDLKKSSLTPPGCVFSIMWPLLYCSLAILGYRLHKAKNNFIVYKLFKLYCIQIILNWLWSPIFFNLHLTQVALLILTFIVIINAYIILLLIILDSHDKYLVLPYFLWICFALYLNAVIVVIN